MEKQSWPIMKLRVRRRQLFFDHALCLSDAPRQRIGQKIDTISQKLYRLTGNEIYNMNNPYYKRRKSDASITPNGNS